MNQEIRLQLITLENSSKPLATIIMAVSHFIVECLAA